MRSIAARLELVDSAAMERLSPTEAIERGVFAHQAGRLEEALRLYREALRSAPEDAEANSLCGLALFHLGRYQEAEPLLVKAVELEPDQAGFRANLAELLEVTGRSPDAVRHLRQALSSGGAPSPVWERLAAILTRQGNWVELAVLSAAWTRAFPAAVNAWRSLSRAEFEQGRHRSALEAFRHVVDASQDRAADLTAYAGIAMHAMDLKTAAEALAGAEALDPDNPETLATRGLLLTYYGCFDEAERYCRRCLERNPGFVPVYATLSRLIGGGFSDAEMNLLSRLSTQEQLSVDHRISAAFALGHGYDARNDVDAAFRSYQFAHRLSIERNLREGRSYDPAGVEKRVQDLIARPTGADSNASATADSRPTPIFIVGMPRSGTTLIESVLSAHSRVRACGERPRMQSILRAWLDLPVESVRFGPDPGLLEQYREAYFSDLDLPEDADHVTDKNPLNYEAAGFISVLFPDAIIIHVRRNPVDTSMSIFRNEFSKFWTFADRLEDIGHFYGQYARLASHWEGVLGRRFVTIQYEEFAANFEASARALVSACGLRWEQHCLDFQSAPRPITTFSAVQARGPVVPKTGYADHFRAHTGPLLKSLRTAGVNLATGALN